MPAPVRSLERAVMGLALGGLVLTGCGPVSLPSRGSSSAPLTSPSPAAAPVEVLEAWSSDVLHQRFWAAAGYFVDVPELSIDGEPHRPAGFHAVAEVLTRFECGFDILSTGVDGEVVRAYATGHAFSGRPNCATPLAYSLVARFREGKIQSLAIDEVVPAHP